MTPDCKLNGWAIIYYSGLYVNIGWFLQGSTHGNRITLNANDFPEYTTFEGMTGWYENGTKKDECKDDPVYKKFNV